MNNTELAEVKQSLDYGWITTGTKTCQCEAEFARFVGVSYAVAVNSCTAAMHLALEAISLQLGDLVLITPYTFAAAETGCSPEKETKTNA